MKKRYIALCVVAGLLLIGSLAYIWNKYCSTTRIAFVNYQAIQLGEIARANDNPMISVYDLPMSEIDRIEDFDMVFINGMGLRITSEQRDAIDLAGICGLPVLTTSATNPQNYIVSVDEAVADTLIDYLGGRGRQNYRSALNYVRTFIDKKIISCGTIEPVVERRTYMLSHSNIDNPDDEDLGFTSVAEYQKYIDQHYGNNFCTTHPAVIVTGLMGDPTDLIAALEQKQIAVYYVSSLASFIGAHHIDSIAPQMVINMAHGRMGDAIVDFLAQKNIPLLAPLNANRLDSEWEADKQGMSGGFMSQSIVTPEIDGAIRPYTLFAQRMNGDIREAYTIPDRLSDFTQTVCNYLNLKQKKNADKKVAIVYFKGPGQAALTASGMEVVPSLYNMLVALRTAGYNVSGLPQSADELEKLIQAQGAVFNTYNDEAFDQYMRTGNPLLISKNDYEAWVKKSLSPDMYSEVVEQHGAFPGKYMSTANGEIGVARIQFGNVVIMPQPLASSGDDAFAIVHGTNTAPSHLFIAPYLWMQYGFEADVLIHFGTHGGLEYTPRKQVALSSSDWPDRLVGCMPHLYLYTIGNVGESLIAKRRTYAGIQSHLTPPFMESNLRGIYQKLDNAIAEYDKASGKENAKEMTAASLKVKQLSVELGIAAELKLDTADFTQPYTDEELMRIEAFAEEIANEKITGQLYTLGVPYEAERIESSVYAMSTDPIAYSLLALDKQLGRARFDTEKYKTLFTQHYIEPAKKLVAQLLSGKVEITDAFICKTAGISASQLSEARQIDKELNAPKDMMSMMMNMQAKMIQPAATDSVSHQPDGSTSATKSQPDTATARPDSTQIAKMREMAKGMDPKKALQMAKMMGAPPEALKKMAAAMGVSNAQPKGDGLSNMMSMMAQNKKEFNSEEKNLARAIMEVERTLRNVGKYKEQLLQSPQIELQSMLNALNGGFTRPTPGGDIICNPNALPTGRNMFGINAEATPSETAWEKGKELAEATIKQYRKAHNDSVPRKVSYTLWSGEFIETEGATIAQVLYMLGVEPIRDAFGRVTDLRLIPSSELGRERIDVVVQTSGQLRDLAASRLYLITRAVEMAVNATDDIYTNEVKAGVEESERTLTEKGLSPKEAHDLSTHRVFGGVNGNYGTGIQGMVQQGDKWTDVSEIAQVYLNNMGAYYGSENEWEQHSQVALEAALTRTDAIIQPRQSNTWGALSLDHVYEFMGGMNLAVKTITGKEPEAYLADYRNRNNAKLQDLKEAIGVESRATILNPTYIKEKMKGGATSASGFAEIVENTYGWNVLKPTVIEERLWNDIYDVYINDKYQLGVQEFFKEKSPTAMQQMTATMKQSIDKGLWNATPEQKAHIERINNQMQQLAAPTTADSPADNQGTVLKKETLSTTNSETTFISTAVVVGVVLVAIIALLFIVKKRRKEDEE